MSIVEPAPGLWERSAFVVTPPNVALEIVPDSIARLFIQVAWGTDLIVVDPAVLAKMRELGFELYAWAWGNGEDVEGEAAVHAEAAQGYAAFCANLEEPYDAHGDSSSPKWEMPTRYLEALDWDGPLALTTTPRFASDMSAWIARGACYQVQCFELETGISLTHAVHFAQTYGWPLALQRPLVQAYPTRGQRPNPTELNLEAFAAGVGGIPYTLEQALDSEGQAWLETMRPTIERVMAPPPKPTPEPPPVIDRPAPAIPFARALYPADDPRGGQSGQDVVAIQRAISRAGFWPWADFSKATVYTSKFAREGVAEFQKSVGIQATGNYGAKTHEALRIHDVDDEWAFDVKAADLYCDYGAPQLPFGRALYGPADPQGRGGKNGTTGSDVIAVKRALSRAGYMEWGEFTNVYGKSAVSACQAFQRAHRIDATGNYGKATHEELRTSPGAGSHSGAYAFDAKAIDLYAKQGVTPAPSGSPRQKALDHLAARVGYTEQPAGSNCDVRKDGIRTAQDRTAGGGTWLRNQPWCGCWCFYALEIAGVSGIDSHIASVAQIEDYARAGRKCYRGWTTDRSKVKPGDLAIIGGYGVHVETVRAVNSDGSVKTYGGNTSPGTGGSQSNGGGAFARTRYPSEVRGFALVRYPGE